MAKQQASAGTAADPGPRPTSAAAAKTGASSAGASPAKLSMTPAAALKRHVEWLEYALGAARSEETWRAGRLEKATKANRDKRTLRLGEVRDEIAELSALLQGIRALEARGRTPATRSSGTKRTTKTTAKGTTKPTTRGKTAAGPSRGTGAKPAG